MRWTRGSVLGRGSTATVSSATSTSGNIFAVKSKEFSQSETLQKEQHFLSNLSSPYVVNYKGCDITKEDNKIFYNLLIDHMSSGSIIDVINRRNGDGLKNSEIVKYTRDIVRGLEYVHSRGVVHCDIKGRNILINESGARIGDFGCAKWGDDVAPISGTPMFMAPEVARGEEQGFPADIWAVGCTIIEMASGGNLPWGNVNNAVSVLYKIAFSGEIPGIPDELSDEGKDFVGKCLIRDPRERWTAKELLKHPYLRQFDDNLFEMVCEKMMNRDSPTSILDQDVWDSMGSEFGESMCPSSSLRQRIEQLASVSEMPNWRSEKEESDWITIRMNGELDSGAVTGVVGEEMGCSCSMSGGEDDGLLVSFVDAPKISCRQIAVKAQHIGLALTASNANLHRYIGFPCDIIL